MAKLYSKKKLAAQQMKPKKETISFLLNYSKALSIREKMNDTIAIASMLNNFATLYKNKKDFKRNYFFWKHRS